MPRVFLLGGLYGLALGALILSYHVTWAVLDLFLKQPYELGDHTTVWMNWHAIGCCFVGVVSLLAGQRAWAGVARRQAAHALAAIYGIWALQNLWFTLTHDHLTPVMWLHFVLCAAATVSYAVWIRENP